jgi:hypothetical protein
MESMLIDFAALGVSINEKKEKKIPPRPVNSTTSKLTN